MKWKNIDTSYKNQLEKLKQQNSYERLGLEFGASMNQVKHAYRKKVSLYHPDRTDIFMTSYHEEVIKLLNQAVEQIKKES